MRLFVLASVMLIAPLGEGRAQRALASGVTPLHPGVQESLTPLGSTVARFDTSATRDNARLTPEPSSRGSVVVITSAALGAVGGAFIGGGIALAALSQMRETGAGGPSYFITRGVIPGALIGAIVGGIVGAVLSQPEHI